MCDSQEIIGNAQFWGRHKAKEITPIRKFSCSICNKSIDVFFPVYTLQSQINNCSFQLLID